MTNIPITHVTLYKHGVGFFERRGDVSGQEVELTFRVEEMNDVLKSLTAIDHGGGRVLSINYATPESREEKLAGSSVRLGDARSLQDLLISLRGRQVRLALDQGDSAAGRLVGIDEMPERQPLDTTLVSILVGGGDQVETLPLARLRGVEILDETAAGDLRFVLDPALTQEDYRRVVVNLTPGDHDLSVAYVAPAPTWRVSYRLVADEDEPREAGTGSHRGQALLLGWGIVDNRLEEDLEGVSLSLVAGMPISFRYDLYTPFTPERPLVQEEARVAAAPVEFETTTLRSLADEMDRAPAMRAAFALAEAAPAAPRRAKISREALAEAAPPAASGEALGELFQYTIATPVSIGRGQSAMVPIVSAATAYRKDLLYNGAKLPAHPVATLRFENDSGLTLERGPVTVIEKGEYVGEAVLPFTQAGGEVVVPYAVELGVKVREEMGSSREIQGLRIHATYLLIEEWDVRWREVRLANGTAQPMTVLVEHPRTAHYDLIDTPEPAERTAEQYRFQVEVLGRGETVLRVQERRLLRRQEELVRQSLEGLERYRRQGLLDRQTHDKAAEVLRLWARIAEDEGRLKELDADRQKVYKAQQQIQGNMGALSTAGKEGALRAQYVDQLGASEEQLKGIGEQEAALKAEIERLKQEVEAKLRAL